MRIDPFYLPFPEGLKFYDDNSDEGKFDRFHPSKNNCLRIFFFLTVGRGGKEIRIKANLPRLQSFFFFLRNSTTSICIVDLLPAFRPEFLFPMHH